MGFEKSQAVRLKDKSPRRVMINLTLKGVKSMSANRPPSDQVRVIFKGLFIAHIRENKDGVPGEAMIGALAPAPSPPSPLPVTPCHQPVVEVLTLNRDGMVTEVRNFLPPHAED